MELKGVFTALVTPFDQGVLQLETYKELCERQLRNGISGLVPCGTTGETPTLSKEEWESCIRCAVEVARKEGNLQGKNFSIAGCGTNATHSYVNIEQNFADAALVVFPYYASQTRRIDCCRSCCSVGLPIVLYRYQVNGQRLSSKMLAQGRIDGGCY